MALNPQLANLTLIVLLLGAVVTDLRARRIPNLLVGLGMVLAITWHVYQAGVPGLFFSLKGLGIGILLLIIPFFLGGMGAGDVKLLGMIGAFMGTGFVFDTFLWMALIGGVIAILYLIKEGQLGRTVKRLWRGLKTAFIMQRTSVFLDSTDKQEFEVYFPYGLAIALGALAAYWRSW